MCLGIRSRIFNRSTLQKTHICVCVGGYFRSAPEVKEQEKKREKEEKKRAEQEKKDQKEREKKEQEARKKFKVRPDQSLNV